MNSQKNSRTSVNSTDECQKQIKAIHVTHLVALTRASWKLPCDPRQCSQLWSECPVRHRLELCQTRLKKADLNQTSLCKTSSCGNPCDGGAI
jgi:hypothetical protein